MATAIKSATGGCGTVLDDSGLHHLAEAATALTQLVNTVPLSPQSKGARTHTVTDDDDHSSVIETSASIHQEKASSSSLQYVPESTNVDGSKQIFPQRLMHILNESSISDIITWLPHGQSFVIVKPIVFTETILPVYFPESCGSCSEKKSLKASNSSACKYPSFTRKLNRWGFRQISRGTDAGAFHHKLFQRDEPDMCLRMVCQRSRRRKSEKKAEEEQATVSDSGSNDVIVESKSSTKIVPIPTNSKRKVWGPRGTPVTDSESDTSSNLHDESKSLPPKKRKHCVSMNGPENGALTNRSTIPQRSNHLLDSSLSRSSHTNCTIGCTSPVEFASKIVGNKVTIAASITNTSVLRPPPKPYLNAHALLEHTIAIKNVNSLNAAVVMAQAHTQHTSLPAIPTIAVPTENISTQKIQNMNLNASSSSATNPSQQAHQIGENSSMKSVKNDAQECAVNAKKMLYSAFLQALK